MLGIFEVCVMAILQLFIETVPESGCQRLRQGPFSGWPRAALSILGQLVVGLKLERSDVLFSPARGRREMWRSSAGTQGGKPCLKGNDKLNLAMQ